MKAEPHAIRLTVQGGGKSIHVLWRPEERLYRALSRAAVRLYRDKHVYVRSVYQVRRRENDYRELEYEVRQTEPVRNVGTVRCTVTVPTGLWRAGGTKLAC